MPGFRSPRQHAIQESLLVLLIAALVGCGFAPDVSPIPWPDAGPNLARMVSSRSPVSLGYHTLGKVPECFED